MLFRRALSLAVLGLFALQGAMRAQGSCVNVEGHGSAGTHHAEAHDAGKPGTDGSHQHERPATQHDECDATQPRQCCEAMTSCGVGELVAAVCEGGGMVVASGIIVPAGHAFDSRETTPEPPPPRV